MPFNCSKTKRAANHQDLRLKGSFGYSILTSTSRLHDLHQTKSFPSLYFAINFPQLHLIGLPILPLSLYNIFLICQRYLLSVFHAIFHQSLVFIGVVCSCILQEVNTTCFSMVSRLNSGSVLNPCPDVNSHVFIFRR